MFIHDFIYSERLGHLSFNAGRETFNGVLKKKSLGSNVGAYRLGIEGVKFSSTAKEIERIYIFLF